MKRIVAVVVATAGAVALVGQRVQARRAEQALWAEITDSVPRDTTSPVTSH